MSNDDTAWPAGKTFGELTPAQKRAATERAVNQLQAELTPAQKRAATERAVNQLQAELTAAAPGIARVLAESESWGPDGYPGDDTPPPWLGDPDRDDSEITFAEEDED